MTVQRHGHSTGGDTVERHLLLRRPLWQQVFFLIAFLAAAHLTSLLSALVIRAHARGWYAEAQAAPWTPPGPVIGSIWFLLYTAMAVGAWFIWRTRRAGRNSALRAFGLQLCLNLGWSAMFFGGYPLFGTAALWIGLVIIATLIVTVGVMVLRFGPISTTAGFLILPYLGWLIFSASLNLYAAIHN